MHVPSVVIYKVWACYHMYARVLGADCTLIWQDLCDMSTFSHVHYLHLYRDLLIDSYDVGQENRDVSEVCTFCPKTI